MSSWSLFRKKPKPKKRMPTWQYRNNPLLPLGKEGQWDEVWATWASVVRLSPKDWRMYYTGRDKAGYLRIGLALSDDGIIWEKHQGNPILDVSPPGYWDSLYVRAPIVWKENASWKMIFTGCDALGSSHYQLGSALSSDGTSWTKFEANPVFDDLNPANKNKFGQHETEGWGLLRDEDGYYLFYSPVSRKPRQVWVARSTDLMAWKPISARPVLPSERFFWQLGYMKYCAWPFRHKGYIYLIASVSNSNYTKSRIGLWRMLGPLSRIRRKDFLGYIIEASSGWCEKEVDTPCVLKDTDSKKLFFYYSGRSSREVWTEGLAFFDLEGSVL